MSGDPRSSVKEPGISTVNANRRNLYFRRVIWDLRPLADSQHEVRHPVTPVLVRPARPASLFQPPHPPPPRRDAPFLFLSPRHLRHRDTKLSEYQVESSFCGRSFNFIPSAAFFTKPVTRSSPRRASSPFRVLSRLIIPAFFFHRSPFSHVLLDIIVIPQEKCMRRGDISVTA